MRAVAPIAPFPDGPETTAQRSVAASLARIALGPTSRLGFIPGQFQSVARQRHPEGKTLRRQIEYGKCFCCPSDFQVPIIPLEIILHVITNGLFQ
jgi:hypothetical protein